MTLRHRLLLCVLLAAAPALAGDEDGSDPNDNYDWKVAAAEAGLTPQDVRHLGEYKVLVTGAAYRQSFEPYLDGPVPPYVTPDAVLNAYHVLYEESIARVERSAANEMPPLLRALWDSLRGADEHLSGNPALRAAAMRQAQVVIGTGLRLLNPEEKLDAPPDLLAVIDAEVERVTAATESASPAWLGPRDPNVMEIDYSRFKPRGLYTRSPELERYFRAHAFLGAIPFHCDNDQQLLAALLIGEAANRIPEGARRRFERHVRRYTRLLGPHDNLDPFAIWPKEGIFARDDEDKLAGDLDDPATLSDFRHMLGQAAAQASAMEAGGEDLETFGPDVEDEADLGGLSDEDVNDQVARERPTFSVRVLPPYRLPDAVLFGRTTDPSLRRAFPTGLEVCAALGSTHAQWLIGREPRGEEVLAIVQKGRPLFRGGSLYHQYLHCLAALLDEPEPAAPALVSSAEWKVKNCQAVLGGWAQMRHTWLLHAKQSVSLFGGAEAEPGVVEPDPEFFARLAALAETTDGVLEEMGAYDPDAAAARTRLDEFVRLLEDPRRRLDRNTPEWQAWAAEVPETPGLFDFVEELTGEYMFDSPTAIDEAIPKIKHIGQGLEMGLPLAPALAKHLAGEEPDIRQRWKDLATLCRRLEGIAHKQLECAELSEHDADTLAQVGVTLAGLMFYEGQSYLSPRDDAPRVADVHVNPRLRRYLHVGVERAQPIYVLYPRAGRDLLYVGAVMPYHEFSYPQRLSDEEWLTLIGKPERPALPEWVRPIYGAGALGRGRLPREEPEAHQRRP